MAALNNVIRIGPPDYPIIEFYNNEYEPLDRTGTLIKTISGISEVDVSGDELSVDTVTLVVQYGAPPLPVMPNLPEVYVGPNDELYLGPDDEVYYYRNRFIPGVIPLPIDLFDLPYGTPFRWENETGLVASLYLKDVEQVGPYFWKLTAVSGIGLLESVQHVGGIYTGETFEAVASEIINGMFPFSVTAALAGQPIYNWLPYDSARNNLHRLLIAMGASIRRDDNGEVVFVFLNSSGAKNVEDERVDIRGSAKRIIPITRYEVTEHAYFPDQNAESEVLYDNTDSGGIASHSLVKFKEPIQLPLTVTGSLTIDGSGTECGVNYAYVTGVGTLTGKPYLHYSRIVAADEEYPAGTENVKTMRDDFTLISLANSQNVAKRMLAYYNGSHEIRANIELDGERCGDLLRITSPLGGQVSAFLKSADVNASSNLLAACRLIANYSPSHQGNNVTGSETLVGTGVWTSPITGTITVVLAQGGTGGGAGNPGAVPPSVSISSYSDSAGTINVQARYIMPRNAKASKGGQPGTPGAGGKVYIATMQVTQGQQIAYSCGVGGEGEVYGSGVGHGSDGTHTTFGSLSSASGSVTPSGFIDPINGDRLGAAGVNGIAGGDGVGWEVNSETGVLELVIPEPIEVDGVLYSSGNQNTPKSSGTVNDAGYGLFKASIPGGFGGGAAYKKNGGNGGVGSIAINPGYKSEVQQIQGYVTATAGAGGNGANALPPPDASGIGQGGTSGNGGGGTGAVGVGLKGSGSYDDYLSSTCYAENNYDTGGAGDSAGRVTLNAPTPPTPGNGSDGGKGGPGGIRIYWGG